MRVKAKYIILIFIPFFMACSEKRENKTVSTEIPEYHSHKESTIKNNVEQPCYFINDRAKKKCDSTLIQIFGIQHFKKSIKWSAKHSFINCDVNESVELMKFGDSTCCNPRTFDLVYNIQIATNPNYQFRMSAGSDELFEPVSKIVIGQLKAYRKLMDGGFKVDYNLAKQIANENGYSGKDMTIELFCDSMENSSSNTSFYWKVDNHKTDDSREILHINPHNGKVDTISLELFSIACT